MPTQHIFHNSVILEKDKTNYDITLNRLTGEIRTTLNATNYANLLESERPVKVNIEISSMRSNIIQLDLFDYNNIIFNPVDLLTFNYSFNIEAGHTNIRNLILYGTYLEDMQIKLTYINNLNEEIEQINIIDESHTKYNIPNNRIIINLPEYTGKTNNINKTFKISLDQTPLQEITVNNLIITE